MIDFYNNYLTNVYQTPDEKHRSLHQATLNKRFDDTTQLRVIKEQLLETDSSDFFKPYEDDNNYSSHEVWLSTVSDDLINTNKSFSDFVDIMFKDMSHTTNYKGQYYKIDYTDNGDNYDYYICYDTINELSIPMRTKCVRCNNILRWIDDESGDIIEFPCYLGNDISSTNDYVTKKITVPNMRMIVFVQANQWTRKIVRNQRFMFEHKTAFTVEEIDNFSKERKANGEVTYIKLYLQYSAILPNDNKEENLCSYYEPKYNIEIEQDNIESVQNSTGRLTAKFYIDDVLQNSYTNFKWASSNSDVVTIQNNGEYSVIGEVGTYANIICSLDGNNNVFDTIRIDVVENVNNNRIIDITPKISSLYEEESVDLVCNILENGTQINNTDKVNYKINSESVSGTQINCNHYGKNGSYSIESITNGYRITNNHTTTEPLILIFNADGCEDVRLSIKLKGLF